MYEISLSKYIPSATNNVREGDAKEPTVNTGTDETPWRVQDNGRRNVDHTTLIQRFQLSFNVLTGTS